jgi:hypothetical protein
MVASVQKTRQGFCLPCEKVGGFFNTYKTVKFFAVDYGFVGLKKMRTVAVKAAKFVAPDESIS